MDTENYQFVYVKTQFIYKGETRYYEYQGWFDGESNGFRRFRAGNGEIMFLDPADILEITPIPYPEGSFLKIDRHDRFFFSSHGITDV